MVGHGGSSAGSYLADPTFPIPSHFASVVTNSTLRVKILCPCVVFSYRLMNILPFASGEHSDWERSLAALTALERSQWAKIRNKYFTSGINKESITAIESAAFHVSYCDIPKVLLNPSWSIKVSIAAQNFVLQTVRIVIPPENSGCLKPCHLFNRTLLCVYLCKSRKQLVRNEG